MRYMITNDGDGHWFLVPVDLDEAFQEYACDPESLPFPDGVVAINGHPNCVTFEAPELRGQALRS